jgi:Predicted membrane protein (DUF2085)
MTLLRPAFVAATVVWALLLPLVPFVASRPHATPIGAALLIAVYAIGGAICHQLPERSYHLWTAQMPVCARCAGIYFGAAIAAILLSVARGVPPSLKLRRTAESSAEAGQPYGRGTPSPSRGERALLRRADIVRAILLVAALPALASLVYEWTTGHMPAHWIRAATGVPLGATVAWLILSSMPRRTPAENQVN